MDNNKIYYHNLREKNVLLATVTARSCFVIDAGKGNTIIDVTPNGYYYLGEKLPDGISIYYDSSKKYYHIVKGENNIGYITIKGISIAGVGFLLHGYAATIDTSSMTLLSSLNLEFPIKTYEEYVTGGNVAEYISRLSKGGYRSQSSLVLLSVRDQNGIGGSALLLLSRINTNTIANFSINKIFAEPNISQFTITGSVNGFTISNTKNFKFTVTEISINS